MADGVEREDISMKISKMEVAIRLHFMDLGEGGYK